MICPHCGAKGADFIEPEKERKTRTGKVTFRRIWRCQTCKKQFSVLVGTIFEDSRIPFSKWLLAIHALNADKNGISSCELARKIGIAQKSAWFMAQRIRFAMQHSSLEKQLEGEVEVDETYVGGLEKNKHASKRTKNAQGRSTKTKTPVFIGCPASRRCLFCYNENGIQLKYPQSPERSCKPKIRFEYGYLSCVWCRGAGL